MVDPRATDPWAVVGEDADPWAVVNREAPGRGFFNNALRGAGAQTMDVIGGVPQAVGGLVSILAPETGRAIQQVGNDIAGEDFAYVPRATWEDVKNAQGILGTVGAAAPFIVEQGIGSLPQIAAMLTGPIGAGTVIAGNTGRIATERAENDGGQFATPGGLALAAPVAAGDTLLDRLVVGRVLGQNGGIPARTVLGRVGGAAALGAVTEAPIEAAENVVTTAGTQRGLDYGQALDAAMAGAVAGGGLAGGVRGGVEAFNAGRRALDSLSPTINADPAGWDVVSIEPANTPTTSNTTTTPVSPGAPVVAPNPAPVPAPAAAAAPDPAGAGPAAVPQPVPAPEPPAAAPVEPAPAPPAGVAVPVEPAPPPAPVAAVGAVPPDPAGAPPVQPPVAAPGAPAPAAVGVPPAPVEPPVAGGPDPVAPGNPMPAQPGPGVEPTAPPLPVAPTTEPVPLNQALAAAGMSRGLSRAQAGDALRAAVQQVTGKTALSWAQLTTDQQRRVMAALSGTQATPAQPTAPAPAPLDGPVAQAVAGFRAALDRDDAEGAVAAISALPLAQVKQAIDALGIVGMAIIKGKVDLGLRLRAIVPQMTRTATADAERARQQAALRLRLKQDEDALARRNEWEKTAAPGDPAWAYASLPVGLSKADLEARIAETRRALGLDPAGPQPTAAAPAAPDPAPTPAPADPEPALIDQLNKAEAAFGRKEGPRVIRRVIEAAAGWEGAIWRDLTSDQRRDAARRLDAEIAARPQPAPAPAPQPTAAPTEPAAWKARSRKPSEDGWTLTIGAYQFTVQRNYGPAGGGVLGNALYVNKPDGRPGWAGDPGVLVQADNRGEMEQKLRQLIAEGRVEWARAGAQPAAQPTAPTPAPEPPARPAVDTEVVVVPEAEALMPGMTRMLEDLVPRLFPGVTLRVEILPPDRAKVSNGHIQFMSPTNFVMRLNPAPRSEAARLKTILHELGHVVVWTRLGAAPQSVRDAVLEQYAKQKNPDARARWALQAALQANLGPGNVTPGGMAGNMPLQPKANEIPKEYGAYLRSFQEWAAERSMVWLTADQAPRTAIARTFKSIADTLREVYEAVARMLRIKPTPGALEQLLRATWEVPVDATLTREQSFFFARQGLRDGGRGDAGGDPGNIVEMPEPTTPGPATPQPRRQSPAALQDTRDTRQAQDIEDGEGDVLDNQDSADTRTPTGTGEPSFLDVSFTNRASIFRQAFRDAGLDPDVAANMPGEQQIAALTRVIQSTFGMRVTVDPKAANIRKSVDQLLDAYRNLHMMMHVLGLPPTAVGLDGQLNLELLSERGMLRKWRTHALGLYAPATRAIAMPDRSNSFAHEWAHAVDHFLSDRIKNLPDQFLTRVGRDQGLDRTKPVEAAFIRVLNALYFDQAKLAARVLALQTEAAKVDKNGDPTKAAQVAQQQLEAILAGNSGIINERSEFWKRSGAIHSPAYFRNPAEMLARAWEAYVAARVEASGGTNEFITKGDASYLATRDARLANTFPKKSDRDAIFQALDDLVAELRREGVLGRGQAAGRPVDMDIVDPTTWDRIAPPKPGEPTGLRAALKAEANTWKNGLSIFRERAGLAGRDTPAGTLPLRTRSADVGRAVGYSMRGVMKTIVARTPKGPARDAIQKIVDKLATDPGTGRFVAETLEQATETHFRRQVNRLTNIMETNGLSRMTDEQKQNLRDLLTSATTKPLSPELGRAAGALRALMDQEWYRNTNAGIKVGYWARNGWLPRLFQDEVIWSDPTGFTRDAGKVYGVIFDDAVGQADSADPDKLVEKVRELQTMVKQRRDMTMAARGAGVAVPLLPELPDLLGADAVKAIKELRALLSERKTVENDPKLTGAQKQAELDRIGQEIEALTPDIHAAVRPVWTRIMAENWLHRIQVGNPSDYDTRGPDAQYVQGRKLPPEADKLLEKWLVNDPVEAVSSYFYKSARRVAYAERFGADSRELDALLNAAESPELDPSLRANPEDVRAIRRMVEVIAGRNRNDLPSPVQSAMTTIHVAGTLALLPRAVWSSIAEPLAAYARTRDVQIALGVLGSGMREIVRGASWRERAELANAIGLITSPLYDTVLMNRLSGNYGDSPRADAVLANFFRRTGLTQITNAQRRMALTGAHLFMSKMSATLRDPQASATKKATARAEMLELGVPDSQLDSFAEWMAQSDRLPDLADLDTPQGRMFAVAAVRFVDQTIQNPTKVDRPEMAAHPIGRMVYGIMSFSYGFFRNIILANANRVARDARIRQEVGGQSAARAWAASAGEMGMHAAVFGGSLFMAQLLTSALREAIFNGDRWDEKEAKGELGSWLAGLAFARMGVTGPFDPIVQAFTGLRYERDLTALAAGPHLGYFLGAAQAIGAGIVGRNSENTNTAEWNMTKGAWQLLGVPAVAYGLTALPGGPFTGLPIGLALQKLTSNETADDVADAVVGEKDSRRTLRERAANQFRF
ncbi:peptidoglycan transglycosylase [Microcystis phage Mae-Yong1326-1]|nr:peptidoglycan transglycosylase [Microcystis phage Mae-Yong1326-1]